MELMRLNLEFNSDASYVHFLLGQFLLQNGEKEAALESVERAARLEPDNRWYKGALERMKSQD